MFVGSCSEINRRHVKVHLRARNLSVAEQIANRHDVDACQNQVRRESVSERVG